MEKEKCVIGYQPSIDDQDQVIEVTVGERVYMDWGAMYPGNPGTVVGFKFNEFYEVYEAVVELDDDECDGTKINKKHHVRRITGYGVGAYLERLGGKGIHAQKRES